MVFNSSMFELTRALEPIDRIINCVLLLVQSIFNVSNDGGQGPGFFWDLYQTIVNSPLLLVSLSLVFCGFVIGILSRLVHS